MSGADGLPRQGSQPSLRTARLSDVPAMAAMINEYAARGLMLPKAPAELHRLFREYVVVVDPEAGVVACGGLRVYSPELGEIVGLAVREGWQGRGLGGRVAGRLVQEARRLELDRVFAMTLQEPFFHSLGFRTIPRAWLPEKESADCRTCARRAGCREIAVLLDLTAPAEVPVEEPGRRELKVLPRSERQAGAGVDIIQ